MPDQPNGEKREQAQKNGGAQPPSRWRRFRAYFTKSEWANVFLTAVIAATGVVGIVLVIRGGADTQKMIQAAQQQATAATKSAQAATDFANTSSRTLQNTKDQFELDERPYVVKQYIRLAEKPTMHEKLAGEIFWDNTGKTPALQGHVYIRIDVLDREPNHPEEWAKQAWEGRSGTVEFGSGLSRSTPVSGDNPLEEPWYARITGRTYHVYVYGALVYKDIFGKSHESYACGRYEPGSINELFLWSCNAEDTNAIK